MPRTRRFLIMATAMLTAWLALSVGFVSAESSFAETRPDSTATTRPDKTRPDEARRVDSVTTPHLRWRTCRKHYQCARVRLPLDYDHPRGAGVSVALLKVPARDTSHRIGSLFLNPGGPGGSGKDIAIRATDFLSPAVLDRFDLIGMDPRGTNDSTRVECYPSAVRQARDTDVLSTIFPVGHRQEIAYARAASRLARTCSSAGQPLSSAMSTAEVARDMDVVRRAVGDRQLSFLGWSYGTYLGQVYANLFPDRVRVLAIDGVLDPVAWRGTPRTKTIPMTMRLNSAGGSSRALTTLLHRCRKAGAPTCPIMPNPEAAFASVAAQLRNEPLTVTDDDGSTYQITYPDFVQIVLFSLYAPDGIEDVPAIVALLQQMLAPQTGPPALARAATRYGQLLERAAAARERPGRTERLANDFELNAAVACSDSRNPNRTRRWADLANRADRQAPYFGRFWLWASATCADWTATDEDAYTGSFNRWTAHPVLVVGNLYDPATNYASAVSVARRLPNSRLLTSDSWGHTAYGTSTCVTSAMDRYLIAGTLPAPHRRCVGDLQPYGR